MPFDVLGCTRATLMNSKSWIWEVGGVWGSNTLGFSLSELTTLTEKFRAIV